MQTQIINAPSGAKWLDEIEFLKTNGLPNGIFDKGSTGCGMTTLALGKMIDGVYTDNSGKYIVALPLNAAIDNKVEQYNTENDERLFVVRAGTKKQSLDKYISNGGTKILVTYDSLYKIGKWLPEAYKEWKLLVDEYQDFLRFYGLKKHIYKKAVNEIVKYDHKTLGSATPVPAKYSPKDLSNLPVYEVVWPESTPINIISQQVSCPTTLAVKLIKQYINKGCYQYKGIKSHSLNVFVNSISSIETIINETDLTPDQCRIICGSDPSNEKYLGKFIGLRGKDVKDPYLITFITSAGYNSIDLYGSDTLSISLSYGKKEHTLQSTFIDLPQIAGRMRNEENPFYKTLFHFYTTVPYELDGDFLKNNPRPFIPAKPKDSDKLNEWYEIINQLKVWKIEAQKELEERFNLKLAEQIQLNKDQINLQNAGTANTKMWTKQLIDSGNEAVNFFSYVEVDGDIVFDIDDDFIRYLRFQMEELKLSYIDGKSLRASYEKVGLSSEYLRYREYGESIIDKGRINFTSALKSYLNDELTEEEKQDLLTAYPDISRFTSVIKPERIRSLDYCRKDLEEELTRVSDRGTSIIQYGISKKLEEGKFYPLKTIKEVIQEVYDNTLGFKGQKAKATDILHYAPRSVTSKPRINGKQVEGYTIHYNFTLKSTIK